MAIDNTKGIQGFDQKYEYAKHLEKKGCNVLEIYAALQSGEWMNWKPNG